MRLALDDFGTGNSSLTCLRRLPFDIVKIDRSFVADIGRHGAGEQVVAAVAGLGHALGMSVTAEGVETVEQQRAVAAIGCEHAQGFLFAAALTPTELLASRNRHPGVPWRLPA